MAGERLPYVDVDDCWSVEKSRNGLYPVRSTQVEVEDGTTRQLVHLRPKLFSKLPELTEKQKRLASALRGYAGEPVKFKGEETWEEKMHKAEALAADDSVILAAAGRTAVQGVETEQQEDYEAQLVELNALAVPDNGLWLPFHRFGGPGDDKLGLAPVSGFCRASLVKEVISPVVTGKSGQPYVVPSIGYVHYPYVETSV